MRSFRHAHYFVAWAEEAGSGLAGSDEFVWRARERAELDNLRAVVTWALDRDAGDDLVLALRIIGALAGETTVNTMAGVGAWADAALSHVGIASAELRYLVIAAAACHLTNMANYERARDLALAAIGDGVPRCLGNGLAHFALGASTAVLGDFDGAAACWVSLVSRPAMTTPASRTTKPTRRAGR